MNQLTHSTIIESQIASHDIIRQYTDDLIGAIENNPDYFELRIKDKQSIGIKEVKEMISWLQMKPFQASSKVAVVLEAEKLTTEAQNSLLKTLEEPPRNSYIFLLTNNHKTLLQTIISRTEVLRLDNNEKTNTIDNVAEEIIKNDIKQQLKWIDSVHATKDPVERKLQIHDFLRSAYLYTRTQNQIDKKKQNLELIDKTFEGLRRNVNIKLLLENFIFNYRK